MGTRVNPALEILVFHFPEEYREYVRNKIDKWYNTEGYHDPEYYLDLILAVYPEHPATEVLFEQQDNYWESGIAIKLGDRNAELSVKENLLWELEKGDLFWVSKIVNALDKDITNRLFSGNQLNEIRAAMIQKAQENLSFDTNNWIDQHSILSSAVTMEWQYILDILSNNFNYLNTLLEFFKESNSDELLWWSLTNKYELTENF